MAKKKTKKFNINERLKKDPINSDWLRNAGKSLGVTTFDVVKEMFPATTDFVEYNTDDVRDVITSLRQNVGSKRMLIQQIKRLPHMKIASDALKNAKDDLKSGNFNNKNRFGDEFDFGFDDSDIFGDDDDFDFDIDSDPTDDVDNKPSTPTTVINTMPLAKAMNNNTQMTVNTMVSIADQQMAMQSEKMAFDHSVSNSLISGLGSINDNLSLLVQFNADSTSKYHAASIKYYEESIEYLKYLDAKNKKEDADKKKRSFIDGLFTAEGGLKLGSYGQRIMKNLEDMKDENVIVSSIFDMLKDTDTLKMLASNPLGEITSMMVKKFIPAATKKILGDLDTSMNSFLPAILSRINTFEDNDNQILNYIYKVFGSKEKLKYDVYLGDYEKGAISWDGESKKALVEVIPTYLRRIESALTGNDERIYNYDKGVFVSREDLEKEIDKSISKAEISGYSESKARVREYANKLGMGIEEKEQFFADFEEYLRKSTKKGNRISPIRQRTKDGEIIDDFATENLFDGDRDRQKFMREFLTKGMSVSQFVKMVTSELSDSRSRTARVLQKINDNPTLTGYSALVNDLSGNEYNGSLLARQQEDLVRMLDSRVDEFGYKEIDYLREIKTTLYDELTGIHRVLNTSGIVNASDGFGLKPYDYLRDIRSALVNGIKVFPDKMKRYHGWRPNGDIQDRIRREENDMVARLEALSNQTENITNETNTLSNIINENERRINEISNNNQGNQPRRNVQINRNNNTTRNILGINTRAGSEADEELEDYEIEEQRREGLNRLRAHFGIREDEENQREVGTIARFINERASRLDSRLERYLSFIMFGVENPEDLDAEDSMLERADEMFEEITDEVRDFFDGNAEHDENSLPGRLRAMLTSAGLALFGTRENDGQDGLISRFTENFTAGFDEFRTTLFGERAVGNARTRMSEFMSGIREKLPKAFLSSAGSTVVKAMIAPHAGILGSFLLPGGPIGSLLLGTTTNLLHQSETFNKFMYGELGEDGERKGDGFIPKSVLDMYGKYGKTMKVGAGLGILGSLVLPGGPVTGALLGMGTSLTVKSEAFQELMFGKDFADKDNRSLKNGVFGKLFKSKGDKEFKVENPKLATFLGTAGLGVGVAQGVGLLPSMLLPGGPIVGAVLGLAGGIAASSSKFQEFLFGEKDVDGKRYGGLFTKIHNWFDTSVMGGLKLKIAELNDNIYGFLKGKIFNPIAEAFEPVKQAAVYMMDDVKEAIKGMFDKAVNPIVEAFKDYVAKPLGKALKKVVLDPIAWMLKKTFGFLGKSLLNLTTGLLMAPIKMIGGAAERFNNRHAIRDERKARRSEAIENLRAGRFSVESLFGLAGVMTNEEKEQAMNERNPYRQGKSLRQRKKDHKKELKEEMQARADKRKAMQEQYEADKAFGKSHGWKYPSAKQKAAREQELKEKANWLQEQQLLKAQETEEKVSATGDTVNKIATGDIERNNILKDIRNIFYKFVYGKDADYERDHAPEPYNVMNTPDQTMVDKANAVLDGTASPEIFGNNTQQKSIFSNLIDVIRSRGQSHADGLDMVPNDGYIAELHEGEMVVPKKPAGKLRKLVEKTGKGINGITDVMAEVSDDDISNQTGNSILSERAIADREILDDILSRRSGLYKLSENMFDGIVAGMGNMFGGLTKKFGKILGMNAEEAKDRADNAAGMTELEEKQAKEAMDDMRQAHVSRKDVDFIQAELAEKQEKKEERAWRNSILAAIANVGGTVAGAATATADLPGLLLDGVKSLLKNLGIGGILAGIAGLLAKNQYDEYSKIAEENQASVWDVYQGDYREERKDADGQYVYDNGLVNQVKHAWQGKNVLLKPVKAAYNAGKNVVTKTKDTFVNVKNGVSKLINPNMADDVAEVTDDLVVGTANKAIKTSGDDFAQAAAKNHKGLFNKFIELGKKALSIIADKAEEYFPKQMGKMKINAKSITGCADDIFKKILGSVDALFPKFGKRISQLLANIAGDSTGVLAVVTGGYDLLSGLYAGNAGNLFGVPKNHVDMEMRLITSFIQVIGGLSIFSVVWLINEITSAMFGLDFMQTLARAIYNALPNIGKTADFSNDLIGKDVDSMTTEQLITEAGGDWSKFEGKDLQNMSLKELQKIDPNISTAELMEIQRVDYNNKNGTKLDRLAWKDKVTPTFGGKVWDSLTTTKAEREAKIAKYQEKVDNGEANWWDKMWLNRHQNKLNDEIAKNTGQGPKKSKLQTATNWILNPVGSLSDSLMNGIGTFLPEEKREQWNKGLEKTKWLRNPLGAGMDWLFGKMGKKGSEELPPGASIDDSGNVSYEGAGMGDGEVYDPKEEKLVPIYDNDGTIVSYTTKILDEVTEVKGLTAKDLSIPEVPRNTEIIPQVDQNGNVVSYTTVEKSKKQSLFGRIGSAFSSIFGGSSSASNSSTVDNSSSVTNNTGDTYNTTTNEIDTTPFQPLTEAINSLVNMNMTENVNEEGKAKTGNFLQAIMDPSGYLFKKLLNMGIDIKTSVTGEETDPETVNKAINIFKMLRNPLGYLYKTTKKYMEGDEETVNAVDTAKEKWNETKDNVKEKWNETKENVKEKWNNVTDSVKDKARVHYNKSDEVANIMAGKESAKANVLSSAISVSGDITTAIWNKFASEDMQIAEGDIAAMVAGFINKAVVTPFNTLLDPAKDKFNEAKDAVSTWINTTKENVSTWFTENIKKPWDENKEKAKETQQAILDDVKARKDAVVDWYTKNIGDPLTESKKKAKETQKAILDDVKARKDSFMDWYKTNIGDPLTESKKKADETRQAILDDVKDRKDKIVEAYNEHIKKPWDKSTKEAKEVLEGAKNWVKDIKDGIVSTFNKYVKEPIGEALSPVTTAVSGAWSSLKSAFAPIADIFNAIKNKDWTAIPKIVGASADEARANVQSDETPTDNGVRSGATLRDKIRPMKYRATDSDFITSTTSNTTNNTTNTNTNNKFVFYNQSDSRWGQNKLGKNKMKDSGCGPTALAMAISQLTGEQVTPDTIAKLGKEHIPGYSKYSLFPSVAEKLNMNYNEGYNEEFIVNNLKRGVPVLLSGKTGAKGTPYTTEGHVVTATRIKGDSIFVNDPRGKEYSGYYPINAVLEGLTKGMVVSPSDKTDVTSLSSGKLLNGWNGKQYEDVNKEGLGIYGEVGEYQQLGDISGGTGAGQITMADRVLSYARAFLNNTSKFSYSQPRRLQIDTNKSSSKGCGADCSSFVSHVLSRAGDVNIYGTTSQTFWDSVGTKVDEPQIGDVVCQQGHVGLYSGDGNYIHMSGRKAGIKESKAIQKGNNPHRGYKRVLKNPSQLVDPTVPNPNSFLGTVVGTASGQPVGGSTGGGPQASLDKALLIGDSLTVGMESVLEGKYPNANAMGKGGKWAKHWLESLSELPDAESVGTVIQWLGINGVHDNKSNIKNSQELLTKLKEKYPSVPIFNMRIFPTTEEYSYGNYTGEWWKGLSQEFNNEMSSWAGSNGITQIDATNGFIQDDGFLDPSKAVDGIHFTTDGYKGVLSNIESAISNYNANNSGSASSSGAPSISAMGVFEKFSQTAQNLVASIYNGKQVDLFAATPTDGTTATTPTDGSTPDISGISDNAEAAWKFFTGKGYSPQATAGILGNLQQESGIDPTKKQYGGGPGRGLGQWTVSEERFAGLKKHAESKGKDWTDLQSQLEWIDMELAGKDPSTANILKKNYGGLEGFKKATDTKWAVEAFEKAFERAGKPNYTNRYKFADEFYTKFASAGAGPAMATTAESAPSDGSTPTSMNGWAYYNQNDSQWQEDISGKKIGPSGCGMASHAMMLTSMFGKQITPVTVGKWARKKNLWGDGGMAWEMSQSVANEFGMNLPLNLKQFDGATASDLQKVKDEIKAGRPVVLSGKGKSSSYETPFTGGGHIVLAVGVDGQNRLIINDPRGPERTKAYEDKGILDIGTGLRGAWSFEQTSSSKIPEGWETGGDFTATPGATTPTDGSTGTAAPSISAMGVFEKFSQTGQNYLASIYNGKQVDMFASAPSTSTTPNDTTNTPTGSGNFPKYALNDQQIKGIANILQHEQPGIEGRMAEASLMANLVDKTGDEKATVDNLIKKATGGWFAHGKSRFNNPGNPEQISIDAARTVLVEGKRTLPRYVDEHDCFSDLEWVKNDGTSINKTDRSQYKPHVTKIKNVYGASGTFHSFPNDESDPFYYTSEELRKKWGDDCYSPSTSGAGMGDGKTHWAKGFGSNQPTPKTRYIGGAGMRDRGYTRQAIKAQTTAQRDIEKTVRRINNRPIDTVPATGNQQGLSRACVDLLQAMIAELQAINTNTAETAKGVSEIEIVSANEPVSRLNSKKQGKTTDTRHNSSDTGYNTARKIASFK